MSSSCKMTSTSSLPPSSSSSSSSSTPSSVSLSQIFKDSSWNIERKSFNPSLNVIGKAAFRDEETLLEKEILMKLSETGFFEKDGKSHEVYQHYFYSFDNDSFTIRKNDGVLLHQFLDIGLDDFVLPQTLSHTHQCDPDTYDCKFHLLSPDRFETSYTVTGPNKDYTMHTIYTRDKMPSDAPSERIATKCHFVKDEIIPSSSTSTVSDEIK